MSNSKKKKKKVKPVKIDGLNPKEKQKLRNAIRQQWHRSHTRKLCVQRCIGKDGFSYCELCKKRTPTLKIDHVVQCGDLLSAGFIQRMWTPSKNLQGLCKKCHDAKTKVERARARKSFI